MSAVNVTATCGICDDPWPCGSAGHGGREWRSESVFVATPHRPDVTAAWAWSMMCMLANDIQGDQMLVRGGGPMMFPASVMNLTVVRNKFCALALDNGADWLLMVDADAGFAPDLAARLVQAADPVERPIVGALAFMVDKGKADDMGGYMWRPAPTVYDWGGPGGQPGFFIRWEYPDNTVTRCGATGAHALLIHRTVLEKMRDAAGETWFDRMAVTGIEGLMGEDFSFCAKAQQAGFPIHVHTGVRTTHQQTVWLSEDTYLTSRGMDLMRAATSRDTPPEGVLEFELESPSLDVDPGPHGGSPHPVLEMPRDHHIDAAVADFGQWWMGTLKHENDFRRYHHIMETTRPDIVVELGRYNGASAKWFAEYCPVISVDTVPPEGDEWSRNIDCLTGDSTDLAIVDQVGWLVGSKRALIVLDSDHSTRHVLREIEAYAPLVGIGCHLVVEDGVIAFLPDEVKRRHTMTYDGDPFEAIIQAYRGGALDGFSRDIGIEFYSGLSTMHLMGWWRRER